MASGGGCRRPSVKYLVEMAGVQDSEWRGAAWRFLFIYDILFSIFSHSNSNDKISFMTLHRGILEFKIVVLGSFLRRFEFEFPTSSDASVY